MYDFQLIERTDEVNKQLEFLFSHKSLLEEIITTAISATYSITDNHPKSAKGTTFYNEVIANLRDALRIHGFENSCVNNIELTISRDLDIAFYFCRGNEETGREYALPQSLRKKGDITRQVLGLKAHTARNFDLFPSLNTAPESDITIWTFLIFADFSNNVYRAELGIPLSVNQAGYIDSFDKRIILDINNTTPTPTLTDKPIEFTEGIDIDISQNENAA